MSDVNPRSCKEGLVTIVYEPAFASAAAIASETT